MAGLGHLKKHDPDAARAWVQGKLLVALLIDALRVAREGFSPWGYVPLTTPTSGQYDQADKDEQSKSAPSVPMAGVCADA